VTVDVINTDTVTYGAHVVCIQRQRTTGRRQPGADDDAASETSSVCSETSFRTVSDISDVSLTYLLLTDV